MPFTAVNTPTATSGSIEREGPASPALDRPTSPGGEEEEGEGEVTVTSQDPPAPATNGTSSTAHNASRVRTAPAPQAAANRVQKRPRGGRVHTPVRNISCAGKTTTCTGCLKLVPTKCYADHVKAHLMEQSGTAVVPDTRRCGNCITKGRTCKVNLNPSEQGRKTLRCYCCLKYKETCSHISSNRHVSANRAGLHPALET
ncbi:hypothetical protein OCS_06169 [Ophiocordyceps sinensis CO18]|uniref:Uncharacterized protein n=1 Tax=Ophiocordyceps sinensis (strain Co18 / CGMCC 3.14243) TaxID=911162 RepID=T4ZYC2_OPHSC|nr:hypothetical protein OCS_06169 [Ophiocordyceps sinensis CO18]